MPIAQTNERHEALAQWVWTMGIVVFFALQAVLWLVAITLTLRDPSFAVAQQYEQQAEQWDAIIAQRRSSAALGWNIVFTVASREPTGDLDLRLRIVDRAGLPIDGASVRLQLFHCARAAEVQQPEIRGIGDGWYATTAILNRSGNWKLSGSVRRGGDTFLFDRKEAFEVAGNRR